MKKAFSRICLFLSLALIITGVMTGIGIFAETPSTESAYDSIWVHDLVGLTNDGGTWDSENCTITLGSGCSFGYTEGMQNQEVKFKVNWSALGNTTFSVRASGANIWEATSSGYMIRFYPNGQYDFVANGNVVTSAGWIPAFPGITANTDYIVTIKTVNLSDGNVKVHCTISNGIAAYVAVDNYIDTQYKPTGNWVTAKAEPGAAVTISGDSYKDAIVLSDMAAPYTNTSFPAAIGTDNSITLRDDTAGSGVVYTFQTTDFFSYKFKYTPTSNAGAIRMTFGGTNGSHDFNRDDVVDPNWGWAETGYVFSMGMNGQMHLFRNDFVTPLYYGWPACPLTVDTESEIEYGVTKYTEGNRIHVKVDGKLIFTYFDRATETNTPLSFTQSAEPASLLKSCMIIGHGTTGVIKPCTSETVSHPKTLITADLGTPAAGSGGTFDRNGEITAIPDGRIAGYAGLDRNNVYTFKASFSAVNSALVIGLRGQGTVYDTPWGGSWTNKGYSIYIFPNGMAILSKNGATLCEGWSLGATSLTTGTDYEIQAGATDIGGGAVRVFATVNGATAINYLDTNNAITNTDGGWFTLFNNDGLRGTLSAVDVKYPVTASDFSGSAISSNEKATLSCTVDGADATASAEFVIDTDKTTAAGAEIKNGNELYATGQGDVYVYSRVNGSFSKEALKITFKAPALPEVTGLPDNNIIVFGDGNVTIGGKLSDGSAAGTTEFGINNLTGEAAINSSTGEITPVKAGTVSVYTVIDGQKSAEATLTILPKITVNPLSGSIIKGQTATLTYTANCPLPEGVTVNWSIVEGTDVASVNAQTGVVTGLAIGQFKAKAVLTVGTATAESNSLSGVVAYPQLILPSAPIIAGNEGDAAQYIDANMSDGSAVITKQINVTELTGKIQISEDGKITVVRAGTVKISATVNGLTTEEHTVTVLPKVYVDHAGSFAMGGVYDLSYGANCRLPDEEITAVFEIIDNSTLASLDTSKTKLTVGNTAGTISLRVTLTGESFQAVSTISSFIIEKPIVLVHDTKLPDLFTGQSVTLNPHISQGGFDIASQNRQIIVLDGGDCVEINGLTIKAVKAGTFKFKVSIDGIEGSQNHEIAIESLIPTIVAKSELLIGDTQTVSLMLNSNNYTPSSVVWSLVNGEGVVTFDTQTLLLSAIASGKATLRVVVDEIYSGTLEINVYDSVLLLGFTDNQQVVLGSTINLSYLVNDKTIEGITSVEYVIVEGADCITLSEDGIVTAVKDGTVKIKAVINGTYESPVRTFTVYTNVTGADTTEVPPTENNKAATIAAISIGCALVIIAGTAAAVITVKKRKAGAADTTSNGDSNE